MNFINKAQGVGAKVGRTVTFIDFTDVNQVVRTEGKFFARGFGRAYVHAAIDKG